MMGLNGEHRTAAVEALAEAIAKIAEAAGSGPLPAMNFPQILDLAEQTVDRVKSLNERERRYAEAIHGEGTGRLREARAVMALADEEQADLRAENERLRSENSRLLDEVVAFVRAQVGKGESSTLQRARAMRDSLHEQAKTMPNGI